jgi:hypothetical protein
MQEDEHAAATRACCYHMEGQRLLTLSDCSTPSTFEEVVFITSNQNSICWIALLYNWAPTEIFFIFLYLIFLFFFKNSHLEDKNCILYLSSRLKWAVSNGGKLTSPYRHFSIGYSQMKWPQDLAFILTIPPTKMSMFIDLENKNGIRCISTFDCVRT